MVKELIDQLEENYYHIKTCRLKIADLKKQKAVLKAPLWDEATGTVDAKKDYIKSKTADIDYQIAVVEADIQYWIDICDVLNWRIMYSDD